MKYILEDISNEDYKIFYVKQCDNRPFNRGALKNIGFIAVKNKYPKSTIKFANGGDRNNSTTPESIFCEKNNIQLLWGIGGDNKSNSSSWILQKWKEDN